MFHGRAPRAMYTTTRRGMPPRPTYGFSHPLWSLPVGKYMIILFLLSELKRN